MENTKNNPYADMLRKLFAYALAAAGIFILGRQELSNLTLAMALGAYFAAIGLAELIVGLNTCCKDGQDNKALSRTEVVKKLWGYIAAIAGIFLAALQVNPRLTLIALGGY